MAVKTYAPRDTHDGEKGGVRERETGIASNTKIAASMLKTREDVKGLKAPDTTSVAGQAGQVGQAGGVKGSKEEGEDHHHQLSWAEESRAAASAQAGGESATESERSYNQSYPHCNQSYPSQCFLIYVLVFTSKVLRR
jgi:hypothetical protein